MVAARSQEQHGMFRLSGCPAVRLSGCSVVRLFGCSAARLFSCSAAGRNWWGGRWADRRLRRCRLHSGGSVRNWVPTRFSDQLSGPVLGSASGPASRSASGLLQDLLRDLLSDQLSGPAFRTCFRGCFPDAGAILFDCGMRSVVPIRPQDSSAQFLPQQLPAAGV